VDNIRVIILIVRDFLPKHRLTMRQLSTLLYVSVDGKRGILDLMPLFCDITTTYRNVMGLVGRGLLVKVNKEYSLTGKGQLIVSEFSLLLESGQNL